MLQPWEIWVNYETGPASAGGFSGKGLFNLDDSLQPQRKTGGVNRYGDYRVARQRLRSGWRNAIAAK